MNSNFEKIYNESIKNPEEFWKKVADDMFWFKKPTKILNSSNPPFFKWYEDGITNTCYNALDFHIDNGRGDKDALIYAINSYRGIDRKEIQDMTWEKYTPARWKSLLDNAIDKTMENFKSSRGGVLPI